MNYTTLFKEWIIARVHYYGLLLIAYAPRPPRRSVLHTLFVYPKVIIFFISIAFSGPPSNFLPCYAHVDRTKHDW